MTHTLQDLKHGFGQVFDDMAEGWREWRGRAAGALTRLLPARRTEGAPPAPTEERAGWPRLDGWAFMAADVFDADDRVVVRLEAPGLRREDFDLQVLGDLLVVRGEKRLEREQRSGQWHAMQCAYGQFSRSVRLPAHVQAERATAGYRDGVLRVELPKAPGEQRRRITVRVR
jgi:HSP20 family protein